MNEEVELRDEPLPPPTDPQADEGPKNDPIPEPGQAPLPETEELETEEQRVGLLAAGYELFVTQRNDIAPCSLCGGAIDNWFNCTCASEAMWLYRASQGKIITSACHVRWLTGDCVGGTNLQQMEAVSHHYGIYSGQVYQPINFSQIVSWVASGHYGSHLNISYSALAGTSYDRFHDSFRGNHDVYLSRGGATPGTLRTGDPGATGFVDIPISLLQKAAGLLDLGGRTLNSEAGTGKCYAYVTRADPPPPPPPSGPPAGAAFLANAFDLVHLWKVVGGVASSISYAAGYKFSAYTAGSITAHQANGSAITLRKILTGQWTGWYIHYSDPGVTWKAI